MAVRFLSRHAKKAKEEAEPEGARSAAGTATELTARRPASTNVSDDGVAMGPTATKSLVQVIAEERLKGDLNAAATGASSSGIRLAAQSTIRAMQVRRTQSWQPGYNPFASTTATTTTTSENENRTSGAAAVSGEVEKGLLPCRFSGIPNDVCCEFYDTWRSFQHITCRSSTNEFPAPCFYGDELNLGSFHAHLGQTVKVLRPIQHHALPCVLLGLNVVAVGPSGCGRSLLSTAAVLQVLVEEGLISGSLEAYGGSHRGRGVGRGRGTSSRSPFEPSSSSGGITAQEYRRRYYETAFKPTTAVGNDPRDDEDAAAVVGRDQPKHKEGGDKCWKDDRSIDATMRRPHNEEGHRTKSDREGGSRGVRGRSPQQRRGDDSRPHRRHRRPSRSACRRDVPHRQPASHRRRSRSKRRRSDSPRHRDHHRRRSSSRDRGLPAYRGAVGSSSRQPSHRRPWKDNEVQSGTTRGSPRTDASSSSKPQAASPAATSALPLNVTRAVDPSQQPREVVAATPPVHGSSVTFSPPVSVMAAGVVGDDPSAPPSLGDGLGRHRLAAAEASHHHQREEPPLPSAIPLAAEDDTAGYPSSALAAVVLCGGRESERRYRDMLRRALPRGCKLIGRIHDESVRVVVTQPSALAKDIANSDGALAARMRRLKLIIVADADRVVKHLDEAWDTLFAVLGHQDENSSHPASGVGDDKTGLPPQPQVITLASSYEAVRPFVGKRIPNPYFVQLLDAAAWSNLAHVVNAVPSALGIPVLLDTLLRTPPPSLVVPTNRLEMIKCLDALKEAGIDATDDIHSFINDKIHQVLVATDTVLMGSRIPGFRHVINYGLPARETTELLSLRTRYFTNDARQASVCLMSTLLLSTTHPEAALELHRLLRLTNRPSPHLLHTVPVVVSQGGRGRGGGRGGGGGSSS